MDNDNEYKNIFSQYSDNFVNEVVGPLFSSMGLPTFIAIDKTNLGLNKDKTNNVNNYKTDTNKVLINVRESKNIEIVALLMSASLPADTLNRLDRAYNEFNEKESQGQSTSKFYDNLISHWFDSNNSPIKNSNASNINEIKSELKPNSFLKSFYDYIYNQQENGKVLDVEDTMTKFREMYLNTQLSTNEAPQSVNKLKNYESDNRNYMYNIGQTEENTEETNNFGDSNLFM